MRILVLSQVYWPDTASTAQHLADLCAELSKRGHDVSVVTSSRAYEDPRKRFAAAEVHDGVKIERLGMTGFGKGAVWRRLMDFGSFNLAIAWHLLWRGRGSVDVVLGMTSPPLVSFLGAWAARNKGWKFCYWAMDLQPELAIEAGMIRKGSLAARLLEGMGNAVFRWADRTVALDSFMAEHIRKRSGGNAEVAVLPVWPVMAAGWKGSREENPFRKAQGFGDRIVVMYSGNHAVVHSLDTLLEAALRLRADPRFLFVFIGGGVRTADVRRFREQHGLETVVQLPYQPREVIHESLASADLHVVVMGDGQVGYTHPNKVYGAMFVGRPFLYIGPSPSHVTQLAEACPGNLLARHGDAEAVVAGLVGFAERGVAAEEETGRRNEEYACEHLHYRRLIPAMADLVAGTGCGNASTQAEGS